MKIPIYQVDAFTSEVFGGNPAAVCPLSEWVDKDTMQKIEQKQTGSYSIIRTERKTYL